MVSAHRALVKEPGTSAREAWAAVTAEPRAGQASGAALLPAGSAPRGLCPPLPRASSPLLDRLPGPHGTQSSTEFQREATTALLTKNDYSQCLKLTASCLLPLLFSIHY